MNFFKIILIILVILGIASCNVKCSVKDITAIEPTATIEPVEETVPISFPVWYINVPTLNCLEYPNNNANVLATWPHGKQVSIIGVNDLGDWWQIWDGEIQGWCLAQQLSEIYIPLPTPSPNPIENGTYLGEFIITTYTPDPSENAGASVNCFGESLYNWIGQTVAVDPKVIPLKSWVYIEGIGLRQARDTGVIGHHIDVLVSSNGGKWNRKVWLINK